MMFGALAMVVANLLSTPANKITPALVHVNAGSAHVYASDYPKTEKVTSKSHWFTLPGFADCHSWEAVEYLAEVEGPLMEKGVTPKWLTWV